MMLASWTSMSTSSHAPALGEKGRLNAGEQVNGCIDRSYSRRLLWPLLDGCGYGRTMSKSGLGRVTLDVE